MTGQARGKQRYTSAARRAQVLELVAAGYTPGEVAGQLGLAPRTVRHYLAAPDTQEALARVRTARLRQLAARSLSVAEVMVTVLRQVAEDPAAPPQARVAAAARLFDAALRLVETAELAERVEALEAALQERTQARGGWYGGSP